MAKKQPKLGAGFLDMVSLVRGRKTNLAPDSSWQEVFLPKGKFNLGEDRISPWISAALGLIAVFAGFMIINRLWELQVVQGSRYQVASEENRIRIRTIPAARGVIYDRDGQVLASSVPGFRVVAETTGSDQVRISEIANFLSSRLSLSAGELAEKMESGQGASILLASGLTRDQAIDLEIKLKDFPEVRIIEEPIRDYPNGETLAHLLGFVGEISLEELSETEYAGYSSGTKIGRSGIEATYEQLLRGIDGRELVEVDSLGRVERVIARDDPISGKSISLTVSLALSKSLEEVFLKQLSIAKSRRGAVVAVDPRDGSVLAYLSEPSFNPNLFSRGMTTEEYEKLLGDSAKPLFDRVIGGVYPPGSTFKPTVALAALTEKVTTPTRLIDSPGEVHLGNQTFRNWLSRDLGRQNIVDAIAWSNDIYFYYMGQELGVDRLSYWAARLGFGEKTGISLPGESAGNLPTASWKLATVGEPWYPGDNYNLGIGQGYLLSTPLQLAMNIATIGNGGDLYQPILLKEITDPDGGVFPGDSPVLRRGDLIQSESLEVTKRGMKKACTIFVSFDGDIGCKTGTAEAGVDKDPQAWFVAFAPLDNPEIALAILIEEAGNGSTFASPVARPALEEYLKK